MHEDMDTVESEQSNRLQLVEARTYHIDGKVAAIESQLGQQGTQLNRIEHHLMNKPAPSYGVWVGIGLTILFGCITGLYGLTNYFALQLNPMTANTEENSRRIESLENFQAEAHYEIGVGRTERAAMTKQMEHADHITHANERRIDGLEAEGRAIQTWGNWHDRLENDKKGKYVGPH